MSVFFTDSISVSSSHFNLDSMTIQIFPYCTALLIHVKGFVQCLHFHDSKYLFAKNGSHEIICDLVMKITMCCYVSPCSFHLSYTCYKICIVCKCSINFDNLARKKTKKKQHIRMLNSVDVMLILI